MTLYGYARVSVREPEDKNLDLQVERLAAPAAPWEISVELGTVMVGEAVSETGVSSSLVSRLFPLVFGQCFALFHTVFG